MSEEKKMIVELKKEDRDLLRSVIDSISPKQPKEQHTDEHKGHESLEELLSCPNCYPSVKKAVVEKEFKGADFECEECGLPVKGEESGKEDWECPSCGHKYAKPRD